MEEKNLRVEYIDGTPVALAVIWGFTLLHPLTGQAVPTEALLFLNGVAALSVARILLAYLNNKHE